jgi:predicted nucleic acid-binding protein
LKLARRGKLVILATQRILREAEDNIREAWGAEELERFYQEVADLEWELIAPPTAAEESRWQALTVEKDCHVLAGAYQGSADVLVTLDRRHLLTAAVAAGFPIPVQDTRQFFQHWYADTVQEP